MLVGLFHEFSSVRDRFTVTQRNHKKDPNKAPDYPWPTTNQQGMKAAWRARVKDRGTIPAYQQLDISGEHVTRKRLVLGSEILLLFNFFAINLNTQDIIFTKHFPIFSFAFLIWFSWTPRP